MPTHRYDPVPTSDHEDAHSLKNLPNSISNYASPSESNTTPSYYSDVLTSAPPPFRSRQNSTDEVEQPVPFGAVVPGSVNTTESSGTAWTPSSTITQDEAITKLLARIEKLEADARARENEDEHDIGSDGHGNSENSMARRRKRKDRCCNEEVVRIFFVTLCFTVASIMLCVIAIEWIHAWGKRGSIDCGYKHGEKGGV